MSLTFKPNFVPSDVISHWPAMAFSLWKRSFDRQAGILLGAALLLKLLPAWSVVIGFLIAPSLFIVSFIAAQMADEKSGFSWSELIAAVLPPAFRLGNISALFAIGFGAIAAALSSLASLWPAASAGADRGALSASAMSIQSASADAAQDSANWMLEFASFCGLWAEGVMTMMFLGLFIVAIYQGIFGAVLYAQQGMSAPAARRYGWQAWQMNSESIEKAWREAPSGFFIYPAIGLALLICGFQSIYFAPAGLLFATYIPCLAYVAYRSIFFDRHDNLPASKPAVSDQHAQLGPASA